MVDGQGDVGGQGLAYRFAVLPGLGDGEGFEVFLHAVGDAEEDGGPVRGGGAGPAGGRGMGGVQGAFDVLGRAAGRPR
ncbi:hypothetical protein GCM10020221_24950 [Streptomyces thioluteus]|uniref:Uncharacterized protein n=1 Tax=Streptomyces thioluteus TaxID=66431 RepID=A0ABP6JBL1_STRTU